MNFQLHFHVISLTPNVKSLPTSEQCQNFAFTQIPALEWYTTKLFFFHFSRELEWLFCHRRQQSCFGMVPIWMIMCSIQVSCLLLFLNRFELQFCMHVSKQAWKKPQSTAMLPSPHTTQLPFRICGEIQNLPKLRTKRYGMEARETPNCTHSNELSSVCLKPASLYSVSFVWGQSMERETIPLYPFQLSCFITISVHKSWKINLPKSQLISNGKEFKKQDRKGQNTTSHNTKDSKKYF